MVRNTEFFDNLPQSWYPVYSSSKLKRGSVIPITQFGREWALFRSTCGNKIGFIARYCPHMGIDLSNGSANDCGVVCPMHKRVIIPEHEDKTYRGCSKENRNIALHTQEKYGLIFVFWGKEPLFDLPELEGISSPVFSEPLHVFLDNNYLAVSLNAFDTSHFEFVHNRNVADDVSLFKNGKFHLGVEFSVSVRLVRWVDYVMKFLGFSKSKLRYEVWGDNLAYGRNETTKQNFLAMLSPGETEEECHFYIVAAREKWKTEYAESKVASFLQKKLLNVTAFFGRSFLKSDFPIIKGMKPKAGNLSKTKDKAIIEFWKHKNGLPTFGEVKKNLSWE